MDTAEVRRRLRGAIERARREAEARRARADEASRAYEQFLTERAVPIFRTLAQALTAEGFRFRVFTPAGSVRLASEHAADDFIELTLDSSEDPPRVLGRVSRGRGRRAIAIERPIAGATAVADLTEEDVLQFVLDEISPFVER